MTAGVHRDGGRYDAMLLERLLYELLMAVPSCCMPTMHANTMNVMRSAYSTRSCASSSQTNRTNRRFMLSHNSVELDLD